MSDKWLVGIDPGTKFIGYSIFKNDKLQNLTTVELGRGKEGLSSIAARRRLYRAARRSRNSKKARLRLLDSILSKHKLLQRNAKSNQVEIVDPIIKAIRVLFKQRGYVPSNTSDIEEASSGKLRNESFDKLCTLLKKSKIPPQEHVKIIKYFNYSTRKTKVFVAGKGAFRVSAIDNRDKVSCIYCGKNAVKKHNVVGELLKQKVRDLIQENNAKNQLDTKYSDILTAIDDEIENLASALKLHVKIRYATKRYCSKERKESISAEVTKMKEHLYKKIKSIAGIDLLGKRTLVTHIQLDHIIDGKISGRSRFCREHLNEYILERKVNRDKVKFSQDRDTGLSIQIMTDEVIRTLHRIKKYYNISSVIDVVIEQNKFVVNSFSEMDNEQIESWNRPPRSNKKSLWEEQGKRCIYCECTLTVEDSEVDHFIPRSLKGPNNYYNRVVSCSKCNNDVKSNRLPWDVFSNLSNKVIKKMKNQTSKKSFATSRKAEALVSSISQKKNLVEMGTEHPANLMRFSSSLGMTLKKYSKIFNTIELSRANIHPMQIKRNLLGDEYSNSIKELDKKKMKSNLNHAVDAMVLCLSALTYTDRDGKRKSPDVPTFEAIESLEEWERLLRKLINEKIYFTFKKNYSQQSLYNDAVLIKRNNKFYSKKTVFEDDDFIKLLDGDTLNKERINKYFSNLILPNRYTPEIITEFIADKWPVESLSDFKVEYAKFLGVNFRKPNSEDSLRQHRKKDFALKKLYKNGSNSSRKAQNGGEHLLFSQGVGKVINIERSHSSGRWWYYTKRMDGLNLGPVIQDRKDLCFSINHAVELVLSDGEVICVSPDKLGKSGNPANFAVVEITPCGDIKSKDESISNTQFKNALLQSNKVRIFKLNSHKAIV